MPKVSKKTLFIEKYLKMGYPVRAVAAAPQVKCSVRWVNAVAADRSLPKNVEIVRFGKTEQAILRALVASNMNVPFVARAFSQAVPNITRLVLDVRKRERDAHGKIPILPSPKRR